MINFQNNMIEKAYEFYPKNIDGLNPLYNKSPQVSNLVSESKNSVEINYTNWIQFIEKLRTLFKEKTIIDKTSFFISQPSFSLQISDKSESFHYNVYLSFLIPYYYISKLNKYDNSRICEIEVNTEKIYDVEKKDFNKIINEFFVVQIFPKNILKIKVPNVSFETISQKKFTLKNAFFNKKNTLI